MTTHAPTAIPERTTEEWTVTRTDDVVQVTITRTVAPRNRVDGVLFDLFDADRDRELVLDAVGATVWRACDGTNTVADIASRVADEHDAERVAPVEETLGHFLMQLGEKDLLRFEE